MIGLPVLRCCPRRRLLLTESELTETKAFIRSFVKQVAVAPGRVTGPLHHPHFSIDTKNSGTHGQSIWMRQDRVRRIDRWG